MLLCSGYQCLVLLYSDQVKVKGERRKDSHYMTMNRLEEKMTDLTVEQGKNIAAIRNYFNCRNISLAGVIGFLMIHQCFSNFFQSCSPLKFPVKMQVPMELSPTSKKFTFLTYLLLSL